MNKEVNLNFYNVIIEFCKVYVTDGMEFVIIILGIFLDRVSKLWAMNYFKENSDIVVIKDFFSITFLTNKGAAFGIFQNKVIFLSILTIIVIISMLYYLFKNRDKKLLSFSLAMIIAGALGNLFDRLFYKYVVDFISVHYKDLYFFPVFNVADCFVVVGTILLVIYILWFDKNE